MVSSAQTASLFLSGNTTGAPGALLSSVTLEVDRALEFSPVKNAEGEDSPASCRADLVRLFAGWVATAGLVEPPLAKDGQPAVEIDPLLAEDELEFVASAPHQPRVLDGGHLYQGD